MKASATKGKASQLDRSRSSHRAPGPTTSYLKTRVRVSRLLNAVRILAIAELTRRLHQAYEHAYDKPAADWVLPQKPEGSTLNITNVDDLKNLLKKFYQQYQKKLARCIWSVFATDKNGQPSDVAQIMSQQTMRNAPVNSIVLGYSTSQIGGQGMMDNGLMYIASDLRGTPLNNGRQVYAEEQFFRVYAHELANRLSWQYTSDGRAFGTNGGLKGQAAPFGIPSIHVDNDTGARMENCIWGDVSF